MNPEDSSTKQLDKRHIMAEILFFSQFMNPVCYPCQRDWSYFYVNKPKLGPQDRKIIEYARRLRKIDHPTSKQD